MDLLCGWGQAPSRESAAWEPPGGSQPARKRRRRKRRPLPQPLLIPPPPPVVPPGLGGPFQSNLRSPVLLVDHLLRELVQRSPYTPPPMLSPLREGSGLYFSAVCSPSGHPRQLLSAVLGTKTLIGFNQAEKRFSLISWRANREGGGSRGTWTPHPVRFVSLRPHGQGLRAVPRGRQRQNQHRAVSRGALGGSGGRKGSVKLLFLALQPHQRREPLPGGDPSPAGAAAAGRRGAGGGAGLEALGGHRHQPRDSGARFPQILPLKPRFPRSHSFLPARVPFWGSTRGRRSWQQHRGTGAVWFLCVAPRLNLL